MDQKATAKEYILRQIDTLMRNIRAKLQKSLLLSSNKKLPLLPQPKGIVGGQLKDYQLQSLAWMIQLANNNLSGILADDMGLGKTIQAITYLTYIHETKGLKGKHLIVVPKNVLNNWKRELQTWNPQFSAIILPGTQAQREQCIKKYIRPAKFDILIATYQSVQMAQRNLKHFFWETLIVDQAHSIKNNQTILAACLRRFKFKFSLLLTGTPLSNQLKQLWSLLNFIAPDIFTDSQLFRKIQDSVNLDCENQQQKLKYQSEIASRFKAIINPFLLRRVKSQINLGLKQKKQFTLFVSLTDLQLKLYRNFLKYHSVYGADQGYQSSPHVQLRKICGHPYLFSDIEDPNAPPYGQHLIQSSGKLKLLDKLLQKLLKQKHKVLIFSQFVILLKILQDYLIYRNYKYSIITGQSSLEERDQNVEVFSKSTDNNIFLISTRAGGIGLNLVAADVVILYDLDWNPQMDKQATDRAYRIGQKNSVKVFKFVTNNTVQQRMLQVQKYKLIWDELVIQKGGLARLKAAQQKLQKIDQNKLAGLGAQQIFKLQQNYDDKTIQQIIRMGEQKDKKKTQQIRQKLQKQLQTFGELANPFQNLQKQQANLNQIQYEAQDVMKGNKKNKSKYKPNWKQRKQQMNKYIQPKYYKLYKDKRLAGQLLYELDELDEDNNQERQKIVNKLKQLGFYDWTKRQYELFLESNQLYKQDNYKQISQYINTKTEQQVQQYSLQFYKQGHVIPQIKRKFTIIKNKQQKFTKNIKIKQMQQQIIKIPQHIFNLKNKGGINKATSTQSLVRMYYNGIKQSGICLAEHQDMIGLLNPEALKRMEKNLKTQNMKFNNYEKILTFHKAKTQEQLGQQLEKRYENLRKLHSKQKPKQKQLFKEQEQQQQSAQTAIKT